MKDSVTGKNIIAIATDEHGIVVRVTDWEDFDFLSDQLTEVHDIDYDYFIDLKDQNGKTIGYDMCFKSEIDSKKLQNILDCIKTPDEL